MTGPSYLVHSGNGIARRFGEPCAYCGEPMEGNDRRPSKDHPVPRRRHPGREQLLIVCCRQCNGEKDDRTLPEWMADLVKAGDPRATIIAAIIIDLEALGLPLHAKRLATSAPNRGKRDIAFEIASAQFRSGNDRPGRRAAHRGYSTGEVRSTLADVWPSREGH